MQHSTIPCNSYQELMRLWHWDKEPDVSYLGKQPLAYSYPEDLNDRSLHDAETLMTLARNIGQTAILEIGTSTGLTTLGFLEMLRMLRFILLIFLKKKLRKEKEGSSSHISLLLMTLVTIIKKKKFKTSIKFLLIQQLGNQSYRSLI